MVKIPLTKKKGGFYLSGKFALVSSQDKELVFKYSWHEHGGYAHATVPLDDEGTRKTKVQMHRLILGLTRNDSMVVHHKNGNRLDNRRENLVVMTKKDNDSLPKERKARVCPKCGHVF